MERLADRDFVTKRNTGRSAPKSFFPTLFDGSVKIVILTPSGQRAYKIPVDINQGIPESSTWCLQAYPTGGRRSPHQVHTEKKSHSFAGFTRLMLLIAHIFKNCEYENSDDYKQRRLKFCPLRHVVQGINEQLSHLLDMSNSAKIPTI